MQDRFLASPRSIPWSSNLPPVPVNRFPRFVETNAVVHEPPLAPPEYRAGMNKVRRRPTPLYSGPSQAHPPVLRTVAGPRPLYSGGLGGVAHNRLTKTRIRRGFSTNHEIPFRTSATTAEVVCPRCTATLDAAADHCPNCGHSTSVTSGQTPVRPLIDRPWLIVLAILHVGARHSLVLEDELFADDAFAPHRRVDCYTVLAVAGILWGSWQIWRMLQGA